jgi:hypothetical protein
MKELPEHYVSAESNPEGFPWGTNQPSARSRLILAAFVAIAVGMTLYARYIKMGLERSDFSQVLFGDRALLNNADPYHLIGAGMVYDLKWGAVYPATAYIAAIPFTPLSDPVAASLFVAISSFLLVYGATAGSWHRMPMIPSIAFASSVQFAQWSILITAMLFLPWLSVFAAVKPQATIPVVGASASRSVVKFAFVGALLLLITSLAMLPRWPIEWWNVIQESSQLRSPLLRFGGLSILLVLLRWRRQEAWLVFLLACVPQTWGWYNLLPLLAVAATYREASILSLVSSIGAIATVYFVGDPSPEKYYAWGSSAVAFAYLPATIVVLRRPNVRERPPWMPRGQNASPMA